VSVKKTIPDVGGGRPQQICVIAFSPPFPFSRLPIGQPFPILRAAILDRILIQSSLVLYIQFATLSVANVA